MYMLDTSMFIFCLRHPDSKCAETLAEHIGHDVCISVVTYAELEYGIMNSRHLHKRKKNRLYNAKWRKIRKNRA